MSEKKEKKKDDLKPVTMLEKTYTVEGFIEWSVQLPTGIPSNPFVTIHFKGGQISGYGSLPAVFRTVDPGLQYLIERSPYFHQKDKKDTTIGVIRLNTFRGTDGRYQSGRKVEIDSSNIHKYLPGGRV